MSIGKPVPRASNEYLWVRSVVRSVEKLSGRPSRWNGELNEESRPGVAGSALDDGGMTLDAETVLKPIARAYTAGRPLTPEELIDARDAVLTVVHEAKHLSNALGDEGAAGATPVYSPDTLALEEGLTESWAHNKVDAVIQDIGMDRLQPELLGVDSPDSYPAYTAATDELVRGTAEVTGLSQTQVRGQLDQADRTQRLATAADLVIDQRLADVLPESDREAVRTQLIQTMRPHLADVATTQQSDQLSDVAKSIGGHQAAGRAVTGLSTTTAELEDRYRDAAVGQAQPSAEVEHLRKFLGSGSQSGSYREARGDGAAPDNVRQLPQRGQGQGRE
ncbi:hypothetical protein [Kribbella sp. CA-293567]|uniref:hypothetical protein n=1 Tax=Kribbella sp. CA-293567 TaxID=3002436 RepID=UPI0022DD9F8E|nr:hypothetical protein [Kribbella sp. CA-293567]WBQ06399.1 hypothetical protein OX958_06315 [Kribbella sp. CA-293567]